MMKNTLITQITQVRKTYAFIILNEYVILSIIFFVTSLYMIISISSQSIVECESCDV